MITLITWVGIGMLAASVICYLVGRKVDPIPDDE